jgi:5-(aminomethyl)-3-furanmethanol phosphate kinase
MQNRNTHNRRIGRVVKVGGSLEDLPDLPQQLVQWLWGQTECDQLLVAGGGRMADQVRQQDRQLHLSAETAHWLAVHAMAVNARRLEQSLRAGVLSRPVDDVPSQDQDPLIHARARFVDVETFLRHWEPMAPGNTLPYGWHVTSDSIAARLAQVVGARELVLLKSTLPLSADARLSIAQGVACRLVDDHFPIAASSIERVRVVNLRDPRFPECELIGTG